MNLLPWFIKLRLNIGNGSFPILILKNGYMQRLVHLTTRSLSISWIRLLVQGFYFGFLDVSSTAFTNNMKVYRIAKKQYLQDLSGIGAKLNGGRWNREGMQMLYTSEYLSLAVLEILANLFRKKLDNQFGYLELEIPDKSAIHYSALSSLNESWRQSQYTQQTINIGTEWLFSQQSLALIVPSAVLTQEHNILINPFHKDFSKVKIVHTAEVNLDGRVSDPTKV